MLKFQRCHATCGHARGRFVGVARTGVPGPYNGWLQDRGWFVCPRCGRSWVAIVALYRVRAVVARVLSPVAAANWFIEWSFANGVAEVIR